MVVWWRQSFTGGVVVEVRWWRGSGGAGQSGEKIGAREGWSGGKALRKGE